MAKEFKREKVSTVRERKLITYAITNDDFLRALRPECTPELLTLSFAQRVWGWCADYWDEYGAAPGRHIEDLFLLHRGNMDPTDADMVQAFLAELDANYEQPIRLEYDIKNAQDYLTWQKANLLQNDIARACEAQDMEALRQALTNFRPVETSTSKPLDVLGDVDAVVQAFNSQEEKLFQFAGALGQVIGWICRGDFVAFQGFAKQGKSWFLQAAAQLAEEWGLNVLLVDLEMTEHQRVRRLWVGIKREPRGAGVYRVPLFYRDDPEDENEMWKIQYRERESAGLDVTPENVERWMKERKLYYKRGGLKMASFPPGTLTPEGLFTYCKNLEYFHNFKVDVLVIDYADKMKGNHKEERHRLNQIWTALRAYALSEHIAVITASQSGRDSADGESAASNISEDIRKVAEVTHLLTISSTKAEREAGLFRIKNEAMRDGKQVFDSAYVTACLDIGCAALDSRFMSEVEIELKEEKKKSKRRE